MIFDKDYYDRSLWLMIKADRKNRNMIVEFVRSIPKELRRQIQKSISIYKEEIENNRELIGLDDDRLYGEYETPKRISYWYDIDSEGSLSLGYRVFNGVRYDDAFEMKLVPYDDLYQLHYFDEEWIGMIDYDITTTENLIACCEKEYNIVNTPFGNFVISMLEDRDDRNKLGISRVNLKKMPDEMFMKDLDGEKNIKKLVKGKKR